MTRRLALLATAAALCSALAAAASAGPLPRFSGCYFGKKSEVRPARILIACGDGNFFLTGLRWSRWSAAGANAAGTAHTNDCTPNCASGHFRADPVTVHLFRPRACKPGLTLFTRLAWRFGATKPGGVPRRGSQAFPFPHVGHC